ncbi:hypothetical protein I4F81_006721 [Pyropia yezoensis]|uniref:Uncharacterized protein n=1 Tax=Pyropia yezoensis TaxID=2788 RepID=A0ACC3C335_PYRYE|nr:hypothetical protein I4F81_006721 [Neopyropia yezoensis]
MLLPLPPYLTSPFACTALGGTWLLAPTPAAASCQRRGSASAAGVVLGMSAADGGERPRKRSRRSSAPPPPAAAAEAAGSMDAPRRGAERGGGGDSNGGCEWNAAGLSEAAAASGDLLAMTNATYRAALAAPPPPGGWKVAAFDLDHTLIAPRSAKARFFGPTETTWAPAVPHVLSGLAATAAAGYLVVVLTNQGGLSKQPRLLPTLRGRVESFAAAVGPAVPFAVYAAPGYNRLRKPAVGLWEAMVAAVSSAGGAVDAAASFYVGDAAGRPKDFADTDRKLALNAGLRFFTPEAFFGTPLVRDSGLWRQPSRLPTVAGEDLSRHPLSGYDPATDLPSAVVCDQASSEAEALAAAVTPAGFLDAVPSRRGGGSGGSGGGGGGQPPQTVVLLVGCPGSGKSTFAERHLTHARGYVRVSTDDVGTVARAAKAVREALALGQSVVVDNTHGGVAARKVFLDAARRAAPGAVVKALVFDTPRETAWHLNLLREGRVVPAPPGGTATAGAAGGGAPAVVAVPPYGYFGGRRRVPTVAFNVFAARYVEPTTDEGFHAIGHVRFVPSFRNSREVAIFCQRT